MKLKFKTTQIGRAILLPDFVKKAVLGVASFFRNVKTSYLLATRAERIVSVALFAIAFLLAGYKFYQFYLDRTVLIPASGGEYSEAIVGDVRSLNPILAQTDAEKNVASLLFSGLVKVSDRGEIIPDLAERYEVSPDGKIYTFYLRKDLAFSDGVAFSTDDIAYTIDTIKKESKSPLQKSFQNVTVAVNSDSQIMMTLPNSYGPFIFSCNFGILPSHMSSNDFAKSIVGTGPFAYAKSVKADAKIKQVDLKTNPHYRSEKPLISQIKLSFFSTKDEAKDYYENTKSVNAIFGAESTVGTNYDYKSSKHLGLIFNLRNDKLKDKAVRQKIVEGTKFDAPIALTLKTLDQPLQRDKAEQFKNKLHDQGIDLTISYLNIVGLSDALTAKDYELLLYGFDNGYDRDPYIFWHTSQMTAMNFAGWSDKASDILLEDARMLQDPVQRNAKYDQFFATVASNYLAVFYDPINYNFRAKENIKGIQSVAGTKSFSHYSGIADWYLKEKRVKK